MTLVEDQIYQIIRLQAQLDELREVVHAHPALLILLEGRITKLEAALKEARASLTPSRNP